MLSLVRVVKVAGGTYAALVVIQTHRFCMETTADTGNLSRNEKWLVEIRSYEFREKKYHTHIHTIKNRKQSSELCVF